MTSRGCVWVLVTVALAGCLSMPRPDIRERNASSIQKLRIGMTKQEVFDIMGTQTETVREDVFHEMRLMGHLDLEVANPYKMVAIEKTGEHVLILYYYTEILGSRMGLWDTSYESRKVPDDLLTPVVLKNGTVIGWGRGVLEKEGLKGRALPDDTWMQWGS